jgi:prophage regulatory protein
MHDRLLYRVEEVAEMLRLGRSKTYELIASGAIPVVRLGRCVRVPAHALRRWLETQYDGNALASEQQRVSSRDASE